MSRRRRLTTVACPLAFLLAACATATPEARPSAGTAGAREEPAPAPPPPPSLEEASQGCEVTATREGTAGLCGDWAFFAVGDEGPKELSNADAVLELLVGEIGTRGRMERLPTRLVLDGREQKLLHLVIHATGGTEHVEAYLVDRGLQEGTRLLLCAWRAQGGDDRCVGILRHYVRR